VDSRDIQALIDRPSEPAAPRAAGPAKARHHVDIASMLRRGLLNVDKGILEDVSYGLLDLRDHGTLEIEVVSDRDNLRVLIFGETDLVGSTSRGS
jgi:hypothetical protein